MHWFLYEREFVREKSHKFNVSLLSNTREMLQEKPVFLAHGWCEHMLRTYFMFALGLRADMRFVKKFIRPYSGQKNYTLKLRK